MDDTKTAIWCRVSTGEQDTKNQLRQLRDWAERRGLEVVKVYQVEQSAWRGAHRKKLSEVMDGWLVHYNFFRPHEALKGRTPAWAAGVRFPYANWADVVRKGKK